MMESNLFMRNIQLKTLITLLVTSLENRHDAIDKQTDIENVWLNAWLNDGFGINVVM
jgi:hypothetical protein